MTDFLKGVDRQKLTKLEDRCRGVLRVMCFLSTKHEVMVQTLHGSIFKGLNRVISEFTEGNRWVKINDFDRYAYFGHAWRHYNLLKKQFELHQAYFYKTIVHPRVEKLRIQPRRVDFVPIGCDPANFYNFSKLHENPLNLDEPPIFRTYPPGTKLEDRQGTSRDVELPADPLTFKKSGGKKPAGIKKSAGAKKHARKSVGPRRFAGVKKALVVEERAASPTPAPIIPPEESQESREQSAYMRNIRRKRCYGQLSEPEPPQQTADQPTADQPTVGEPAADQPAPALEEPTEPARKKLAVSVEGRPQPVPRSQSPIMLIINTVAGVISAILRSPRAAPPPPPEDVEMADAFMAPPEEPVARPVEPMVLPDEPMAGLDVPMGGNEDMGDEPMPPAPQPDEPMLDEPMPGMSGEEMPTAQMAERPIPPEDSTDEESAAGPSGPPLPKSPLKAAFDAAKDFALD